MERKPYSKPTFTVVSIAPERGYASSIGDALSDLLFLDDLGITSTKATNSYSEHETWSNGSDHFWD
ncbi:MAG: hypothetical protein IJ789_01875 [Bacteroidales bacterium]|nr:hypothetical protein [Bacteroidales bacterium]